MQLFRPGERREGEGDAVKRAVRAVIRPLRRFLSLPRAWPEPFARRIGEHMRVAAQHFFGDGAHHIIPAKGAGFFRHLGVVDDLKQKIAQLTAKPLHITPADFFRHLKGFFDGVGRYGAEILFDIPGAAMFRLAQPAHQLQQPLMPRAFIGYQRVRGRAGQGLCAALFTAHGLKRDIIVKIAAGEAAPVIAAPASAAAAGR